METEVDRLARAPHGRAAALRLQARVHHPPRLQEGRDRPAHAGRVPLAGRADAAAAVARLPRGHRQRRHRARPGRVRSSRCWTWSGSSPATPATSRPHAGDRPRRCARSGRRSAPRCLATPEGKEAFGSSLVTQGDDTAELQAVRDLLSLADRWTLRPRAAPRRCKELFHRLDHAPRAQAAGVRPAGAISSTRTRSCPKSPEGSRPPPALPRRLQAHRPARHARAR